MLGNNSNTESAKKDIEGIKQDIEKLVGRLGNIQDKSSGIMAEQFESLTKTLSEFKEKGKEKGNDMVCEISNSTMKNPCRNLMYAFGAGVILSLIIK